MANTLVNCTNSYDVKEVVPELVQLAKFSKQHVPEEHPKVGPGQLRGVGGGGGGTVLRRPGECFVPLDNDNSSFSPLGGTYDSCLNFLTGGWLTIS